MSVAGDCIAALRRLTTGSTGPTSGWARRRWSVTGDALEDLDLRLSAIERAEREATEEEQHDHRHP